MISTAMGKWMWYCSDAYGEIVNAGSNDSLWAFAGGDFNATARQISLIGTSKMASVIGCLPFGWGNGNGTFQPETAVNLPDDLEDLGIVPGDFDSDGLLDFIMLPAAGGIQV
jgi:hypothetical protein